MRLPNTALDNNLSPCQTAGSMGDLDELLKVHFVFNNTLTMLSSTTSSRPQSIIYMLEKQKTLPKVKEL